MEAAHGPDKASKGISTKCRDSAAIPLSANCHRLQHTLGWITFTLRCLPWPPLSMAAAYWKAWPGRVAWEARHGRQ